MRHALFFDTETTGLPSNRLADYHDDQPGDSAARALPAARRQTKLRRNYCVGNAHLFTHNSTQKRPTSGHQITLQP